MKRGYLIQIVVGLILLFLSPAFSVFGQDEESDNRPIRPPFETSYLIDKATTVNLYKGGLKLEIMDRFL